MLVKESLGTIGFGNRAIFIKNIEMQTLVQNVGFQTFSELPASIHKSVVDSITSMITGLMGRVPFLLAGLIVLGLFWLLSKLVRKVFLATTRRTRMDLRLRVLISRMLVVFVVGLGFLTALTVVIPTFNFGSLIAGLGFSSFVVGFATKDILNNFFSGILILWRQPFHIGDYLFVSNNQGKVEYIGVRATSLRKDDGELVLIPNGDMYSSAITIRGAGTKRRMTLKFVLGYERPVDEAKAITMLALTRTHGIVEDPSPKVLVAELTAEGVNLSVTFWINTNEERPLDVFDRAAIAILTDLKAQGIGVFESKPTEAAVPPTTEKAVKRDEL